MELQQLKYFVAIAKYENLTKAAQKLHVSQPSLSRSLHSLEDELGVMLFDRVGRNIVLNDVGRIALTRILTVLDSAETVHREISEYVSDRAQTVNFYSPVPLGHNADVILGFKEQYPDIHLRVGWKLSEVLEKMMPDITFFASPIVHREPNYLMLGEENVVVAVSKKNPLANKPSVKLTELSNENWVLVLGSRFSDIVNHMFLDAGYHPHVILEDQESIHIMQYIKRDFAITIAPSITWFEKTAEDDIVKLPISDIHRKRYLYLKWPENSVMTWATLRFRQYLVQHFNDTYGFNASI